MVPRVREGTITLRRLRLFRAVVDHGSLNRAAAELVMAQSAVSQAIASLEEALGVTLLERSTRGVRPTPAGARFVEYTDRILALVDEAEREVVRVAGAREHRLAIGSTPGLSVYLLPGWLRLFQETHDDVGVALRTALTHEVVRDVLAGIHDLGFVEGELDELDRDGLGRANLMDIAYTLCVAAGHPWVGRDAVRPYELSGEPFVDRLPSSRSRAWLERTMTHHGIEIHRVAELDSPGAIKFALLDRKGVGILPMYAIEGEVARSELHTLRIEGVDLHRPLLVIWDRHRALGSAAEAFLASLGPGTHGDEMRVERDGSRLQ